MKSLQQIKPLICDVLFIFLLSCTTLNKGVCEYYSVWFSILYLAPEFFVLVLVSISKVVYICVYTLSHHCHLTYRAITLLHGDKMMYEQELIDVIGSRSWASNSDSSLTKNKFEKCY